MTCEILAITFVSLILRIVLFFFCAFFGPCVPIPLNKQATLITPAKDDIKIRFLYSTNGFITRIHNWQFKSFWVQTLQCIVTGISRPAHLIPSFLYTYNWRQYICPQLSDLNSIPLIFFNFLTVQLVIRKISSLLPHRKEDWCNINKVMCFYRSKHVTSL